MMTVDYSQQLAEVVNSRRFYTKPFEERTALRDKFVLYDSLDELPPQLAVEFSACLASGQFRLGDPNNIT